MVKKILFFIGSIFSTLVLAVFGLFSFTGIGASDCDTTGHDCSCFCCHMFGLRGYESCGDFGALLGSAIGILISLLVLLFILLKRKKTAIFLGILFFILALIFLYYSPNFFNS